MPSETHSVVHLGIGSPNPIKDVRSRPLGQKLDRLGLPVLRFQNNTCFILNRSVLGTRFLCSHQSLFYCFTSYTFYNNNTVNMKASIVSASLFAAAVSAHGNITSPPARQAGAAMAAVCGQDAVDTINADPTIPLEDVTAGSTQCE